jgi:UDP-N-acetylglucosamine/UDP-N-acetylgalactosamine diphosphorylase
MTSRRSSDLEELYAKAGQRHVFDHYDQLSSKEQEELLDQLREVPIDKINALFRQATAGMGLGGRTPPPPVATSSASSSSAPGSGAGQDPAEDVSSEAVAEDPSSSSSIEPYTGAIYQAPIRTSTSNTDGDDGDGGGELALMEAYRRRGLQAISSNQVAAVVLAGGQGTRLGFDGPKGLYDIGLPSRKTLFQLQAERIRKVQELASSASSSASDFAASASSADGKGAAAAVVIPFYVMTSPLNHDATIRHFEDHTYFGLTKDQVFFFRQGVLPCLDFQGRILMESPGRVAVAPDGNGGIYPALQASGALDDMARRGVTCLTVFSVDNALVRPADPVFVGYCLQQRADVGNKVVRKLHPHEAVGVLACKKNPGRTRCCVVVVEYSEITPEMAELVDPATQQLAYGAANIAHHYFTVDFVRSRVLTSMQDLYHAARKKIPYYDFEQRKTIDKPKDPNGIKLEAFIFDAFMLSQNMAVMEVSREDEFAPVKNAAGQDSPESARRLVSQLAKRWIRGAGGTLVNDDDDDDNDDNDSDSAGSRLCEIVPGTSYAGEGLEGIVESKGGTVECPFLL